MIFCLFDCFLLYRDDIFGRETEQTSFFIIECVAESLLLAERGEASGLTLSKIVENKQYERSFGLFRLMLLLCFFCCSSALFISFQLFQFLYF
jgi:hypothetical protein